MRLWSSIQVRPMRAATLATIAAALLALTGAVAIRSATAETIAAPRAAGGPTTAEALAQARARASGQSVVVDADTTASSAVVANPNGSFTFTGTPMPTRVKRGDGWVPIDATLHATSDGTLVPAAVASSVKLSGGGSGPLATLGDDAGHALGFGLPMTLPKPTIAGASATYASVLPGVDLVTTTSAAGGIREVLVVHDAKAAANPVLTHLRLPITATGLTVSVGSAGNIVATDPAAGTTVFEAPAPLMWDSALPGGITRAGPDDLTAGGDRIVSTVAGPGRGATVTTIPDSYGDGVLTLSPPATAVTGPHVTYPLFIDPSIHPNASPYGYTQSNHTTRVEYNPTDDLKVGNDDWTTNCGSPCYINGVTRSYLGYANVGGLHGKTIESALLGLNQIRVSCTGGPDTIKVAMTSGNAAFTSSTSWSNQPAPLTGTNQWNFKDMDRGSNEAQTVPMTNVVNRAVNTDNWTSLNLVIYAANESNDCIYRHFSLAPPLTVTYWSTPNAPTSLTQINAGQTTSCNTTSPGTWIGAASGNQITLGMRVSSVDTDVKLTGHAALSANGGTAVDHATQQVQASSTSGGAVPVSTTVSLTDGASYSWSAKTVMNAASPSTVTLTSSTTATCYFRYDATAPGAPTATSTAYPVNGPTTVISGGSGTITLSATDSGSGLASYNYNINGSSLADSGEQNTTGSSISVPLQGLRWGTNTVWLQAVDKAGNLSSVSSYNFLVQQSAFGAYTPGTAGDIDGDNKPDLVTVDTAGAIHLYSAPDTVTPNPTGDTTHDPNQYGGKVLLAPSANARWAMPDSASAAGALVAHGGSFTGDNYDDLLVEQNGHLAVARNPGTGGTWTFNTGTTDVPKPACAGCANYNGTDWSSVTQMIVMPVGTPARPDLLTVEVVNGIGTVWHYVAISGSLAYNPPVAISTYTNGWHWDDVQLISAGPLPGTTGTTLWVKLISTSQLYLFHNLEAGIADPNSAKIAIGSPVNLYGLITTVGRADSNGAVPVWATDFYGRLVFFPTYTNSSGVTTMYPAVSVSNNGWSNHQVALGSNYLAYNNSGVGYDGGSNDAFDANLFNGTDAYSSTAMANATMNPDAIVNDGSGGCATGWTSCAAGVGGANTIFMPRGDGTFNAFTLPSPWAHRNDNYIAQGQNLPVPTPGTSGPAHTIRFLGAATTFNAAGESVPITITYTNGHTQAMTLTFGDWCTAPIAGNTVVATMDHRLISTTGASQVIPNYLFMNPETTLLDNGSPLGSDVQIATITVGVNTLVHIFSIAIN